MLLWWTVRKLKSPDDYTRREAIEALSLSRNKRAAKPLLRLLKDDDHEVRLAAAEVLGRLGWDSGKAERRPSGSQSVEIAAEKAPTMDLMPESPRDSDLQQQAVEALWPMLWDPGFRVRRTAVDALSNIGGPRARELLVEALQDPSKDVRWAAVWALGEIGDPQVVEPLSEVLQDPVPDVRRAVVEALGKIGDRRAVEPLVEALHEELATVAPERTLQPLVTFATNPLLSEEVIPILEQELERTATHLATEDLREVIRLPVMPGNKNPWNRREPPNTLTEDLLFSVRQLAQQELARREEARGQAQSPEETPQRFPTDGPRSEEAARVMEAEPQSEEQNRVAELERLVGRLTLELESLKKRPASGPH